MTDTAPTPRTLASPDLAHLHAHLPGAAHVLAPEPICFEATDGTALHGQWFAPADRDTHAVAVMAPATGVPQRYYHAFATWLAQRGYAVLCFDYRGMGPARAQHPQASMRLWLRHDLSGALHLAHQRTQRGAHKLPLLWIGHSLGGNGLPLVQGLEHIDAAVTVGSQFGYWKLWPRGWHRWVTRFFFGTWIPLWVRLAGKLPGWALGGGETLPRAAARDWSRWGMSPGYFRDDPRCAGWYQPQAFQGHMQLWSIEDDKTYGPVDAVDALADCYATSPGQVERMHLHPRAVGLRAVGHFGVFRKSAARSIWPLLLERIEARVPGLRATA
ncbi:alpha/beta hydrolase [Curvibacter sp. APW13]|uniref:alpha/beta hydrolase family protein n=1 Tax=Curvibacter sp. APW13 TaxID=3077236 RepID=UPI0028DDE3E3|nr:alpha/beta hydrolase [Curvibacter sp. APW13]MDT8990469.1 alpha/beta hydrolase [Curvibacter sp. APW13]